ncbi:unnamed protein product, partial [Amoebophrya sp. A25]
SGEHETSSGSLEAVLLDRNTKIGDVVELFHNFSYAKVFNTTKAADTLSVYFERLLSDVESMSPADVGLALAAFRNFTDHALEMRRNTSRHKKRIGENDPLRVILRLPYQAFIEKTLSLEKFAVKNWTRVGLVGVRQERREDLISSATKVNAKEVVQLMGALPPAEVLSRDTA